MLDNGYGIEYLGLKRTTHLKSNNGRLHPYPYAKTAQKIGTKWKKSKTSKPLDVYIDAILSTKEKEKLRSNSIQYITKEQQKNFTKDL